ncbi:hypothetical protein [Methylobacterium nigriterrae]|uniref:hypothetical protein n=1 Tax=Methylobacterium nigriterrae TaxID=3127512 RepID=UPI0030141C31
MRFRTLGFGTCFAILLLHISQWDASAADLKLDVDSAEPTVVFRWSTDRCSEADLPDAPFRAFRRADGAIVGFASHFEARRFVGRTLDALKHDCRISFQGSDDSDPQKFGPRSWIVSLWTRNGKSVAALVHNEYQAHRFPGRCIFPDYSRCWYNFLSEARSDDGGKSFERIEPGHPLVALARPQSDEQGRPRGFFGSSNLIEFAGFVYALTMTTGDPSQPRGICLLRASNPFDPSAWQIWTDAGFAPVGLRPTCKPMRNLFGDITALVRHRATGQFIAVNIMPGGPEKGKVAFSQSSDLMNWSEPQGFYSVPSQYSDLCASARYSYPSLIDASAATRTFEDVGDSAYLYMVRSNISGCSQSFDRDLVRFRVHIRAVQ